MFGFCLTQDLRYIVSVSNKFITWDLSTSDLTREVIPGIEGIMQDLVLSPDNKYSIAHTNNNQVSWGQGWAGQIRERKNWLYMGLYSQVQNIAEFY